VPWKHVVDKENEDEDFEDYISSDAEEA